MSAVGESPDTIQALPQGPSRLALEGRYAFHMVFQERWEFSPTRHHILPRAAYPAQNTVLPEALF